MADIEEWKRELREGDVEARRKAVRRLLHAGTEAGSAAEALVEAVSDEDEEVVEYATAALETLGPPPKHATPGLIQALSHSHPDCSYWAATLLGRLREAAEEAVPGLEAAVRSHAVEAVRERAVWALGEIGPAAAPARETLLEASRRLENSARLVRLAKESLARIDTEGSPSTGDRDESA